MKEKIYTYLQQKNIFMQQSDLFSSNLVVSVRIYSQHTDLVNGLYQKTYVLSTREC